MMHDRSELLPIHNLKEHKQISKNQSEFLKLPEENMENGGAGRNRTDDLLLAKQALSQLSYSPTVK